MAYRSCEGLLHFPMSRIYAGIRAGVGRGSRFRVPSPYTLHGVVFLKPLFFTLLGALLARVKWVWVRGAGAHFMAVKSVEIGGCAFLSLHFLRCAWPCVRMPVL